MSPSRPDSPGSPYSLIDEEELLGARYEDRAWPPQNLDEAIEQPAFESRATSALLRRGRALLIAAIAAFGLVVYATHARSRGADRSVAAPPPQMQITPTQGGRPARHAPSTTSPHHRARARITRLRTKSGFAPHARRPARVQTRAAAEPRPALAAPNPSAGVPQPSTAVHPSPPVTAPAYPPAIAPSPAQEFGFER